MQFHEKLKKLRLQEGLSQAELAEKIFVSRSAVAKWENGLGLPGAESLELLASYFHTTKENLLSDPQTENVIVGKNKTLSEQKIIIAVLSLAVIAVGLIAGLLALFLPKGGGQGADGSISVLRELLFDTEKDESQPFVNYSDEEISSDKPFSASRIFYIDNQTGFANLPALFVRTTVNGKTEYAEIKSDAVTFFSSDGLVLSETENGKTFAVSLENADLSKYEGFVNIKYGDLLLSLKIVRTFVSVQSVKIELSDRTSEIGLTQTKRLNAEIKPSEAVDSRCVFSIVKIERADGSFFGDETGEYVFLSQRNADWYLTVTKTAELGSKIYIVAQSEAENIPSNELVVEIKRIPIEKISFSDTNDIFSGESKKMCLTVYPENATANVLDETFEVTLLTPDIAGFIRIGDEWQLTASDEFWAIGQEIEVKIVTAEGFQETFKWKIFPVPVGKILIFDAVTDTELAEETRLTGETVLRLYVKISPDNASFDRVSYNLYSDVPNFGAYVSVSEEGVLTVLKEPPFDLEIFISATTGRYSSAGYKIVVVGKSSVMNQVLSGM